MRTLTFDKCGNLFQSSPAPKGRCNIEPWAETVIQRLFQSSPAPKGRCNDALAGSLVNDLKVSILTGPEGPMQRPSARPNVPATS